MNIQTTVDISRQDLVHLQQDSLRLRGSLLLFTILPLMGVVYLASYFRGMFGEGMLFAGLFITLFPLALVWGMRRQALKIKRENASFRRPIHYRITDEALEAEAYQGTSHILWPDAWYGQIGKHAYYVYLSSAQAMILPKRAFSPEERQQIEALLRERFVKNPHGGKRAWFMAATVIFALMTVGLLVQMIFA